MYWTAITLGKCDMVVLTGQAGSSTSPFSWQTTGSTTSSMSLDRFEGTRGIKTYSGSTYHTESFLNRLGFKSGEQRGWAYANFYTAERYITSVYYESDESLVYSARSRSWTWVSRSNLGYTWTDADGMTYDYTDILVPTSTTQTNTFSNYYEYQWQTWTIDTTTRTVRTVPGITTTLAPNFSTTTYNLTTAILTRTSSTTTKAQGVIVTTGSSFYADDVLLWVNDGTPSSSASIEFELATAPNGESSFTAPWMYTTAEETNTETTTTRRAKEGISDTTEITITLADSYAFKPRTVQNPTARPYSSSSATVEIYNFAGSTRRETYSFKSGETKVEYTGISYSNSGEYGNSDILGYANLTPNGWVIPSPGFHTAAPRDGVEESKPFATGLARPGVRLYVPLVAPTPVSGGTAAFTFSAANAPYFSISPDKYVITDSAGETSTGQVQLSGILNSESRVLVEGGSTMGGNPWSLWVPRGTLVKFANSTSESSTFTAWQEITQQGSEATSVKFFAFTQFGAVYPAGESKFSTLNFFPKYNYEEF